LLCLGGSLDQHQIAAAKDNKANFLTCREWQI
jgi:hypothetical protein